MCAVGFTGQFCEKAAGPMVKPPMKVDGGMNMVKVGNCATGPC